MAQLTLDQARAIYRQAIERTVRDDEGADWWQAVHQEVIRVLAARNLAAAAAEIAWWHSDWGAVGDTAAAAARRLRQAAKALTSDVSAGV